MTTAGWASRLLVVVALAVPVRTLAHEFWLAPTNPQPASGETIEIHAFTGTGFCGEQNIFEPDRVVRLEVEPRRHWKQGSKDDLAFARVEVSDETGTMVGYQSDFASIELPADRFDRYLKEEGLEGPLRQRARLGRKAGPGRERYMRCCKTWIQGREAAGSTKPLSQRIEIVPIADPTRATSLPIRVLYEKSPLQGALVRAWNRESWHHMADCEPAKPVFEGRTDAKGMLHVPTERPGAWLIATVHMVPGASRRADWDSFWASFTYTRSATDPARPRESARK